VQFSANMSNLGALMFPFMLMYLNSKLPKPARPRWWHYVILVLNFLFFGFFFVNFVYELISGSPLVKFEVIDSQARSWWQTASSMKPHGSSQNVAKYGCGYRGKTGCSCSTRPPNCAASSAPTECTASTAERARTMNARC
jgi:hypothetical protein